MFFNEGNLGTHILGQGRLDEAVRVGLTVTPGVEAHFAELGALGDWERPRPVARVPLLAEHGLDFRTLRWHLVQSRRARSARSGAFRLARRCGPRSQPVGRPDDGSGRCRVRRSCYRSTRRSATGRACPRGAPRRVIPSSEPPRAACSRDARCARAPLVLAWTGWAARAVERDAPGANVVEHHPGLDLQRHRPAERRGRALPRVLFVGGRFREKGGDDLLDALGEDLGRTAELDLVTPAQVAERPGLRVHRLSPGDPRVLELQQQADLLCLPQPRRRGSVGTARGDGLRDARRVEPRGRDRWNARRWTRRRAACPTATACARRGDCARCSPTR